MPKAGGGEWKAGPAAGGEVVRPGWPEAAAWGRGRGGCCGAASFAISSRANCTLFWLAFLIVSWSLMIATLGTKDGWIDGRR